MLLIEIICGVFYILHEILESIYVKNGFIEFSNHSTPKITHCYQPLCNVRVTFNNTFCIIHKKQYQFLYGLIVESPK